MRSLSGSDILTAWERGLVAAPPRRADALLELAWPGTPAGALPLGDRELRLLTLRASLFGPVAPAVSDCPACGARLEVALDLAALTLGPPRAEGGVVRADGVDIAFRLPTARDVEAALSAGRQGLDPRRALALACVVAVDREGAPADPAALSDAAVDVLGEAFEALDPQADIELALTCPECGGAWSAAFDPGAFLWAEVRRLAEGLLDDVHRLAAAYGWTEARILAMSPARRRAYLDRLEA